MALERIIIVRDKTRLEQLIDRFNSKAQARFYLERSGEDFDRYETEHTRFYSALKQVERVIKGIAKYKVLQRGFLPSYIFAPGDFIIVLGQDGLVANTGKYANDIPIIGVNPDPDRYDGILLLHSPETLSKVIRACLNESYEVRKVGMAEAVLNDGQTLLAFNDFYIGASSHVSSRYRIDFRGKQEEQSSSGILVATGAGSTGWISSVINMVANVNRFCDHTPASVNMEMAWEDERLIFAVREPFASKASQTNIGFGVIKKGESLRIESRMPSNGVIFSDGIEADFLNFNSGSIAEIRMAKQKAVLVL